jgi:hypothetical protein
MESAFGVDHGEVSKGLPSAIKAGAGGAYGAARREASAQGKFSSVHRALQDSKKPGWTTHRWVAGDAAQTGRNSATSAKKMIRPGKGNISRIGSKPGETPGRYKNSGLVGRGPSGYSGRAKPWSS